MTASQERKAAARMWRTVNMDVHDVPLYLQKATHMLAPGSTFSDGRRRWRLLRLAKDGDKVGDARISNKLLNKWWAVPVRGEPTKRLFCFDHVIDAAQIKLRPS